MASGPVHPHHHPQLCISPGPSEAEIAAFDRLLSVAQGDTGQSRKCANFLLAWFNAGSNGGFDPTDMWGLDRDLADAVVVVFGLIARWQNYPTSLPGDRGEKVRELWAMWRGHP